MVSNGLRRAGLMEKEAGELLAGFVAEGADGEGLAFERWVRGHPRHESALRALHERWSTFERELGRLRPQEQPLVEPPELHPGSVVGDFQLIEVLGEGGMGRVWRARQNSLQREIALKVVLPCRTNARGLSFFEREARAAGRVHHPGVVAVFADGEDRGVHWIAAELVPGGRTVAHLLDEAKLQDGFAPGYFARVARLFAEIAEAVTAAHAVGVIHRDLKPRNILLAPGGSPKVTDFGLARIVDERGLSKTGDFAGTYYYMSPEQVAAKRIGIDHRTDVFSLGAVLYEALTLHRPFEATSAYEVAEKILHEELPDPHRLSAEVPRGLASICVKALEKRRNDRFASMEEMCDELWRFARKRPLRTRPPGFLRRVRKRVLRHPMRSALAAVGAASLSVCGLFLAATIAAAGRAHREGFRAELYQAQLAVGQGDLRAADVHLRHAGALESLRAFRPFLAEAVAPGFRRLLDALELEHQGDWMGAIAVLEELRAQSGEGELGGSGPRFERALGRLDLRAGRIELAREQLETALESQPGDFASRVNLAQVYLLLAGERGRPEEACEAPDQAEVLALAAIDARPSHPIAHGVAAQVAAARFLCPCTLPGAGDLDLAFERLDAALAVDGDDRSPR